ncbi:uncharacterized protein LAESUDRAFT_723130 [Laetiporus sulphureus 93-53]|uniref:Uncharacterized protein n=1 Tax=Laetiporus sulphureus 93-53 TaxID=1314785 RepID=A0A165FT07_9APHY|nr:uncharacterized protein LAESUDRAFT_723130 [Laetiporus sulphureus 93-53]KZT09374.1 hypothetical protein LAESUDRAFT_723130 [Laetiporus sulphureus 93-53]
MYRSWEWLTLAPEKIHACYRSTDIELARPYKASQIGKSVRIVALALMYTGCRLKPLMLSISGGQNSESDRNQLSANDEASQRQRDDENDREHTHQALRS